MFRCSRQAVTFMGLTSYILLSIHYEIKVFIITSTGKFYALHTFQIHIHDVHLEWQLCISSYMYSSLIQSSPIPKHVHDSYYLLQSKKIKCLCLIVTSYFLQDARCYVLTTVVQTQNNYCHPKGYVGTSVGYYNKVQVTNEE